MDHYWQLVGFPDAQSLAVGNDNPYIEPLHLLSALLAQEDGGTTSLFQRSGVNVTQLRESLKGAIDRLPKVEGSGGEVSISRELNNLFNLRYREAYSQQELLAAGVGAVLGARLRF